MNTNKNTLTGTKKMDRVMDSLMNLLMDSFRGNKLTPTKEKRMFTLMDYVLEVEMKKKKIHDKKSLTGTERQELVHDAIKDYRNKVEMEKEKKINALRAYARKVEMEVEKEHEALMNNSDKEEE